MKIILNGDAHSHEGNQSINSLLDELKVNKKVINYTFITLTLTFLLARKKKKKKNNSTSKPLLLLLSSRSSPVWD